MNDFKTDIQGCMGVVKTKAFHQNVKGLEFKTKHQRTFVIEGGGGCSPEPATPRRVTGHWLDGKREILSSYDLEFVVKNGKEIYQTETPSCEVDIAPEPMGEAAKEVGAKPPKPFLARRK
jgi:hypothetical protein